MFDQVKEQVELIEEKVMTIDNEKDKIMQIIIEIDKKKKKAFPALWTASTISNDGSATSGDTGPSLQAVTKRVAAVRTGFGRMSLIGGTRQFILEVTFREQFAFELRVLIMVSRLGPIQLIGWRILDLTLNTDG